MEREEDKANLLLEEIQKELVSIIEDGSKNKQTKCEANFEEKIPTSLSIKSEIAAGSISDSIDGNIHKMQNNLDECYKLLQTVSERFENINFNCLKTRIRDLRLNERSNDSIKAVVEDLRASFDMKYIENRMNDLTKEVTTKFREHPGEFGDIPELNKFFTTCTQLQRGLEKLQKYTHSCRDLENEMFHVAEASYDRVNDIQCQMNMDRNRSEKQIEE